MTNRDEYPRVKPDDIGEGDSNPSEHSDDANAKGDGLTVDGLRRVTEALRLRVEAAHIEKVRDVKQKVADREALIGEERKNDELLRAVQESLTYYESLDTLGNLSDDDRAQLEKLRSIVTSLDTERLHIRERADALTRLHAVGEHLFGEAKNEDTRRAIEKDMREAHEKLDPEIDAIAHEIQNEARRKRELLDQRIRLEAEVTRTWMAVEDVFKSAKTALGGESDVGFELDNIYRFNTTPDAIQQALTAQRQSLGRWGKGREKAALDSILYHEDIFKSCAQAITSRDVVTQQIAALQQNFDRIADRYRGSMLQAWETQRKVNKVTNRPYANDLLSDLAHRLREHKERAAGLEHWEGGKRVGKYKGWHEANKDPVNAMLYDVSEYIKEKAGGHTLIYEGQEKEAE